MPNIAWCPTIPGGDKEVKEACRTVKHLPGNPQVIYGSSSKSLDVLKPDETLYIISHGHPALPVFNV